MGVRGCGIDIGIGLVFSAYAQTQQGCLGEIDSAEGIIFLMAEEVIAQHSGEAGDGGGVGTGGGVGGNAIRNSRAQVEGIVQEEAAELHPHVPIDFVGVFREGDGWGEVVQGMNGGGGLSTIAHEGKDEEAHVKAQVFVELEESDSVLDEEVRRPLVVFSPVELLRNKQEAQFFILAAEEEASPPSEELSRAPLRALVGELELGLEQDAEGYRSVLIHLYFKGISLPGICSHEPGEGGTQEAGTTKELGEGGRRHRGGNFLPEEAR